ncbi:LuxR family transcriptional regulator [Pseudomonas sp. CCM 7891]|uniref:LuxR family transcriptional regulator n=1 Tax=Pseudomonas karstica TaxID=1055468 RepID=A0A7X2RXH8_9PSED|nr:LuxR C-terminal-related transcriptional regulator [Pseudomonas karstica]MTD22266.1 LuxR family transcriptional regulator [Pseudomonas karstica]
MNSHLFPHIGKVIASTGSRRFPRMLHDLILTQLDVDATHIMQLRVNSASHSNPKACTLEGAIPVYTDSVADSANAVMAVSDPAWPAAQLHLTRRKDNFSYVLSVYRSQQPQHFSAQERIILQNFSSLLLPMVEKHITAIQPCSNDNDVEPPELENQGIENLHRRFDERLAQSGLNLSKRELQVCVGLLAGRTAPQLAVQMALKVNTIESYLKRAAIKMGISGRHSLLRWMYSTQDSTAL